MNRQLIIRISSILTLFLLSTTIFAQSLAEKELQAASKHLINKDGTEISFIAETIDNNTQTTTSRSEGLITIKNNKFRLSFGDITAVFDGEKTLIYYDSSENTLNLSHPTKAELAMINPLIILTQSEVGYKIETLPPTKGSKIIGLTPKISNGIKRIEFEINSSNSSPMGAVIILEGGSRIVTKITSIRPKKTNKDLFQIKKADYPKAEIIDLR